MIASDCVASSTLISPANPVTLPQGDPGLDFDFIFQDVNAVTSRNFDITAGDFNRNGQVQNTDYANMVLTLGTAGYRPGDFDLNGQVQNTDLQLKLLPNIGRGAAFP